jgi:hypothetical protein
VIQYGASLLYRHAREPIQELVQRGIVFEVLEKGCDRDARAAEHPGAADTQNPALRVA